MASFPCCRPRTAVLPYVAEGAALPASRQIGAEPRRLAAQEAIITLERQHGQPFALLYRQKADTAWPDRVLAGDKLMFAAARLGHGDGAAQRGAQFHEVHQDEVIHD